MFENDGPVRLTNVYCFIKDQGPTISHLKVQVDDQEFEGQDIVLKYLNVQRDNNRKFLRYLENNHKDKI